MALVQIDMGEIAELGTQVAMHGAIRAGEVGIDDVFEIIVGLVLLVVEIIP